MADTALISVGVAIAVPLAIAGFRIYWDDRQQTINQLKTAAAQLAEQSRLQAAESLRRVEGIFVKYLDIRQSRKMHPLKALFQAGLAIVQTDDEARDIMNRWAKCGGFHVADNAWIADHPEPLKVVKDLCAYGFADNSQFLAKYGKKGTFDVIDQDNLDLFK